jgi:hypothetical protein
VSCKITSIDELAKITPVNPPIVNKKTNPIDQHIGASKDRQEPFMVANHLNTFTPVGIAMIMVAAVK